jgi:hypothetical protein
MRSHEIEMRFRGSVPRYSEASSRLVHAGDAVLIHRNIDRSIVFSCPCGCQEQLPINLDGRAGPAWHLYWGSGRDVSLFPSVWRESGCKSHFIVWHNKIYLLGTLDEDIDQGTSQPDSALAIAIIDHLPRTSSLSFAKLAEDIGAIPWDVLSICRQLVRVGAACEGRGKRRGHFRRP